MKVAAFPAHLHQPQVGGHHLPGGTRPPRPPARPHDRTRPVGPAGGLGGGAGRVDPTMLERLLPSLSLDWHVSVRGPAGLTDAVLSAPAARGFSAAT